VTTCIMGSRSSKSFRRVEQADIDCLNFASGLGGIPTRFPGSVLREKLANERKTVGHLISAQLPDRSFVRDQVIYLDMSNFATAKPVWNLGD
jgi:hypothetical protein